MKLKALLIPADILKPLEFVDFDPNDTASWGKLINIPDENVGMMTYLMHGVVAIHDDIVYLRDGEPEFGLRMNLFDATLRSRTGIRLTNMLAGDFLLTGVDREGESVDLPQTVIDLAHQAHKDAVVLNRKVLEARAKMRSVTSKEKDHG